MNYLIVGASSGLGRALAEELAMAGHRLLLVASDVRDLQTLSADLSLRTSAAVDYFACHISQENLWLPDLNKKISEAGDLDGIFFPLGWAIDKDEIISSPELVSQLIEVNFSAVVKIISACLPGMMAKNNGHLVGFGSVSSLRGRGSNVIYSAAKRALVSYFESLRHAIANTNIKAQIYQLGYLDTPGNFGRQLFFPKADLKKTARYIIRNLDRDFGLRFYPRFWFFLQFIIRWLPWWIFKRLDF